jgi:hypothetical protein
MYSIIYKKDVYLQYKMTITPHEIKGLCRINLAFACTGVEDYWVMFHDGVYNLKGRSYVYALEHAISSARTRIEAAAL